jgi:hypothetical protein
MDFLSDEDTLDLLNTLDEPTQVGSMSQIFNFFEQSQDMTADGYEELDDQFDDGNEELDDQIDEFDVVDITDLQEDGQSHPDWLEVTSRLKSGEHYKERILHFLKWKKENSDTQITLLESVNNYFKCYHDQTKTVGLEIVSHYAPTVFRSWFSIMFKWFKFSGKGDLKKLAPLLYDNLTTWETGYIQGHANYFKQEELTRFMKDAPNNPFYLVRKFYVICCCSNASRSGGMCSLTFFDPDDTKKGKVGLKKCKDGTFEIWYEREKQRGIKQRHDTHSIIHTEFELEIVCLYLKTFKDTTSLAGSRVFRKLLLDKQFFQETITNLLFLIQ